MALDTSAIKSPKFLLRVVELIFSIITFSLVADCDGWSSKIDFTLFTGITAMLLCIVYIVAYLLGLKDNQLFKMIEFVLDVIWAIFWFATACAMAALINEDWFDYSDNFLGYSGGWCGSDFEDRAKASTAFAWFTWALWMVSCFYSFKDVKDGGFKLPSGTASGQPGEEAKPAGTPPVPPV